MSRLYGKSIVRRLQMQSLAHSPSAVLTPRAAWRHRGGAGPLQDAAPLSVHLYDVFVGVSLTAVLLQIGKLGVLPVTFQTVLGVLVMIAQPGMVLNMFVRCGRQPFMLAFFLLFLATNLDIDARFGLRFGIVAGVGRCLSTLAMMAMFVHYCLSHPRRPNRLLAQLVVLLSVAQLWYVGELVLPDLFVPFRTWLYYDWYLLQAYELNVRVETLAAGKLTGLAPVLHLLGYLSCAALGFSLTSVLASRLSERIRNSLGIFALLGISALTIALNLQRASLAGGIAGAGLLMFSPFRQRLMARLPIIFALILMIILAILPRVLAKVDRRAISTAGEYAHIGEKLQKATDIGFRLQMQVEAIRMIAKAPFGLEYHGLSWQDEGLAATEAATGTSGGNISVHNGYLSLALQLGWFAVVMSVVFLVSAGRAILRCVRSPCDLPGLRAETMIAIAAACFGLIFVQPFLHHGNIFKREPASLIFTSLLSYCMLGRVVIDSQAARLRGMFFRQQQYRGEAA
jgi:hypothetical protein